MKKILVLVPVLALMAAGCGSSATNSSYGQTDQSTQSQQSTGSYNQTNTPAAAPTPPDSNMGSPTSTMGDMNMNSNMWQATLELSNNGTKGHYMITTGGHTIYLNTSRDYSSLVGKPVNVMYQGTMDGFTIDNITAQ